MPDPAPDIYGGGLPSGVVAFRGGYVAVGTVNASCCAEENPADNWGVVWTSDDGRTWVLRDTARELAHASLDGVVTDGSVLLAYGTYAAPAPDEPGVSAPALWTSTDAVEWRRVEGDVPSRVVAGESGFVGAVVSQTRSTGEPFLGFMHSTDGYVWTATGTQSWVGHLEDLIAIPGGGALAVASFTSEPVGDGGPTYRALVWRSDDGLTWDGPYPTSPGTRIVSLAVAAGVFVAVGSVDEQLGDGSISSSGAVWSSDDGVEWQREVIAISPGETVNAIFAVGDTLIAEGDTSRNGIANAMVWVSTDGGQTWGRLPDQDAFSGTNNAFGSLIETPFGILAVGSRWGGNHAIPQAWIAQPPSSLDTDGISVDQAIEIATEHVAPDAVLVSTSAGKYSEIHPFFDRVGPGSDVPSDRLVWAVVFQSEFEICPPNGSPCWSPRPGWTTVIVDYTTGEFIESAAYSPAR
jgi:hypothetical protein